MIATIHQPEYLPWIGFFDRIKKADVFVSLDTVQYQKSGFINRNKIKTAQGIKWVTIPINNEDRLKKINEVRISNNIPWGKRHWNTIKFAYSNAPYFKDYASIFEKAIVNKKWDFISDLDNYLIESIISILGIKTKIIKSTSLNIHSSGEDLNIDICKKIGADSLLLGPGHAESGEDYHLDIKKIEEGGIKVIFQEFNHPQYPQKFETLGFSSYLSVIDILFNCGPKSLEIIKSGSKT